MVGLLYSVKHYESRLTADDVINRLTFWPTLHNNGSLLVKMRLISYYGVVCAFVEMKFFVVIFLATLLMLAATVIQEVSALDELLLCRECLCITVTRSTQPSIPLG